MARVKLIRLIAGPAGVLQPGDIIEVSDEVALSMADAGHAELLPEVKAEPTPEPKPVAEPVVEVVADPEQAAAEHAVAPRQRVNPKTTKKRR